MSLSNANNVPDMPTIATSTYATTMVPIGNVMLESGAFGMGQLSTSNAVSGFHDTLRGNQYVASKPTVIKPAAKPAAEQEEEPMKRFVKVIIVDSDPSVPLDSSVLYNGDEKMTDLNNQELFFELDIKALLATHNEKRVTFIDKESKNTTQTRVLEPARVRDLRMVVVDIAQF